MMRKSILLPFVATLFPSEASAETDYQSIFTKQFDIAVDALRNGISVDVPSEFPNINFEGYNLYDLKVSIEDPIWLIFDHRQTVTSDGRLGKLDCMRVGPETAEWFSAPGEKSDDWQTANGATFNYGLNDTLEQWPAGIEAAMSCNFMLYGPPDLKDSERVPDVAFDPEEIIQAIGVNEFITVNKRAVNTTGNVSSVDKSDHIIERIYVQSAVHDVTVGFQTLIFLKSTAN